MTDNDDSYDFDQHGLNNSLHRSSINHSNAGGAPQSSRFDRNEVNPLFEH